MDQWIALRQSAKHMPVRIGESDIIEILQTLGRLPTIIAYLSYPEALTFKWAAYDDLIDPDYLSKCLDALEKHPQAVLCYPKVNLINEFGETYDTYDPEPDISSPYPQNRLRNLMFTSNLWTYTYGLIRSSTIRKTSLHGSYPSSDEVFLYELLLQGNFLEIPERLFNLRVHSEQSTAGVLQAERNRLTWFNTSLEGKLVLPKWLYFIGCLKAIQNAPIEKLEKLYCLLLMGRWLSIPAHFRAMGKDILIAGNTILRRSFNKQ